MTINSTCGTMVRLFVDAVVSLVIKTTRFLKNPIINNSININSTYDMYEIRFLSYFYFMIPLDLI